MSESAAGHQSIDHTALVSRELAPMFVVSNEEIDLRIAELQQFVDKYLIEGEDYGTIPGTQKPTLYKPGAEKLCDVYGFQRLVEVVQRVEDWEAGFFHYECRFDLVSMATGILVAQGLGSCNSKEGRYRWRQATRHCPECGSEAIIKGKDDYGGGWLCWKKKGGCGMQFPDDTPEIVNQEIGRIENEDPFTLVNTILKMAKKRALIDAVLSATRSSGMFTQDMEDVIEPQYGSSPDFGDKDDGRQQASPSTKGKGKPKGPPKSWGKQLADLQDEHGLSLGQILDKLGISVTGADDPKSAMLVHIRELREEHGWTKERVYEELYKQLYAAIWAETKVESAVADTKKAAAGSETEISLTDRHIAR